jgi:hypothetical protein
MTVHPAVGRAELGGYRYHAPRQQYSSRDLAHNLELKVRYNYDEYKFYPDYCIVDLRKPGQNAPEVLYLSVMPNLWIFPRTWPRAI